MSFDGSDFKGLDEAAPPPDGAEDAWLEAVVHSNALYTLAGHRAVTYAPKAGTDPDDVTGCRPYCSLDWSTALHAPIRVETTTSAMRVRFAYANLVGGTTKPIHELQAVLYNARMEAIAGATVALDNTEALTPLFDTIELTLSIPEKVQRSQVGRLVLWSRSSVGDEVDGVDVNLGRPGERLNDVAFRATGGALPWESPDSFPDDECIIGQNTAEGGDPGTGRRYDVLYAAGANVNPLPPPGSVKDPLGGGNNADFRRHYLTRLYLKGVEIEEVHDLSRVKIPAAAMRANIGVRAEVTLGHPRMAALGYTRPRCEWVGPPWTLPTAESDDNAYITRGHALRWKSIFASEALDTWTPFFEWPAIVDAENPLCELLFFGAGVHLGLEALRNGDTPSAWTYEELEAAATSVEWQMRLRADQMDLGEVAWATASSRGTGEEVTARVLHYPDDCAGIFPFLQQQAILERNTNIVDGPFAGTAYAAREGQLYRGDLPLMQAFRAPLRMTGMTSQTQTLRPVRYVLEVRAISSRILYANTTHRDAANYNEVERLKLVCTGATLYQRGVL